MDSGSGYQILMLSRRRFDPAVASGTPYFMLQALRRYLGDVDVLDGLAPWNRLSAGLSAGPDRILPVAAITARRVFWRLLAKQYDWQRSRSLSAYCARVIAEHLRNRSYDFLFVDKGTAEIAFLETEIPIVYSHDSVACDLIDYSAYFSRLPRSCIPVAQFLEERAVAKAAVCIYSSNWAARSALRNLRLPTDKVKVINNGPNFDGDPLEAGDVRVPRKPGKVCRLLLVGGDWERKGVDVAIEAARQLNGRGVATTLTVCGCMPPGRAKAPDFVTVIPFLDKRDPAAARRFRTLFADATFFILPTRAECCAQVLIEAMAFGLPALCTDIGGNSDVVGDGVCGCLLRPGASGADYAERARQCLAVPGLYETFSSSARRAYESRLNWSFWASEVDRTVQGVL